MNEAEMLCFLGPTAVRLNGELAPLKLRPKARALLARVALADGPVTRSELSNLLFGEADDPRAALRWHLHYLRRELPPGVSACLRVDGDLISLDVATDAATFLLRSKDVIDDPGTWASPILSFYRADMCAGLAVSASLDFDTWLFCLQDQLRRRFREAALAFSGWASSAGCAEEAVEHLQRLLSVDPYCEDAHVALIEVHEACGQKQAAKAAFERYERMVREELQAEPRPSISQRYGSKRGTGRVLPREGPVPLRKVTLHVVEWRGGEPPILAIHGSAGSGHSLAALAERLSPEFRFIAPDLRGHGFSDKPPSGYELGQHVEDITDLFSALGLETSFILGFSLGGAIAAALAAQLAPRGLILLDGVIGTRAFMDNAAALVVPRLGETLESRFAGFSAYLAQMQSPEIPYTDEAQRLLQRFARFRLAPLSDGTYRRRELRSALEESFASAGRTDTLAALGQVRCPVLIVHAKRPWIDGRAYLTDDAVRDQLRACPQAKLLIAPNSDHPALIRDPEPVVIEAIREFVRRTD